MQGPACTLLGLEKRMKKLQDTDVGLIPLKKITF